MDLSIINQSSTYMDLSIIDRIEIAIKTWQSSIMPPKKLFKLSFCKLATDWSIFFLRLKILKQLQFIGLISTACAY